jgi:peroxiredoxin-like protein
MNNIPTPKKEDLKFVFEVKLNWLHRSLGVLHARDIDGTIHVATPREFGGEGNEWSPEHLFLSSISSCFMTTFLMFSKKMEVNFTRFECNAVGQVGLVDGKYQFTQIVVFPKVFIPGESMRQTTEKALEKTEKYCLISNSIKAEVDFMTEVVVGTQPGIIYPN